MTKDEFYRQWLRSFAADISKEDTEKYIVSTGNYIWHAFSWELLDKGMYLSGDAAKEAYNNAKKGNAIYINWFEDNEAKAIPCNLSTAEALDHITEVYVVSKDFSWTYIKTHESVCGPYFMER